MTDWTHGICAACWNEQFPQRAEADEICVSDADVCCWCGRVTAGGIYLRADSRELPHCAGHAELRPGDYAARMMTGLAMTAFDGMIQRVERLPHPDDGWRLRLRSPDGDGECEMLVYPASASGETAETEAGE